MENEQNVNDEVMRALDDTREAVREFRTENDQKFRELEARVNKRALVASATPASGDARFPSLSEYKAMSIGSDPGGGYLVTDQVGPFFDRLRPAAVMLAAGPYTVDMTSDAVRLPGLSASTTVYAVGEAGTITASDLTLRSVRMAAKKYTVRTIASSELLEDSNPSAREIIARDHQLQLAQRLDLDMLQGDGAGSRLLGLRNTPGVNVTFLGASDGAKITLNDIEAALYRLEASNVDLSRVVLFMNPRTWSTLRVEQDQQDRYQIQPDPSQPAPRRLFGQPVFTSTQISISEVRGGSTDCSYVVAVDMSRVAVGRRAEVRVLYDPFSRSGTDEVVVQSITRWGIALLDAAACEIVAGVRA